MRPLLIALVSCLLLCGAARAEDAARLVDDLALDGLQQIVDGAGAEMNVREAVMRLAAGEYAADPAQALRDIWNALLLGTVRALRAVGALAVPAVLSAAARLLPREDAARATAYACALCCAAVLAGTVLPLLETARAMADTAVRLSESIFPVLTLLLTSAGGASSAAVLTPTAALFASVATRALGAWGVRLAAAASALAVCGALSRSLSFERLFRLIRSVVNWGCGILMTSFLGLLGVQGMLGSGYDGLGVRAARYAVDSMVPVIGGEVADTLDAVASSVLLVKNAAGVTGMLAALAVCAGPLTKLGAGMLSLRLAAAVMESVAEECLTEMTDRFARVAQMLLTLCAAMAVMLLMLLGACVAAGGNLVR